jgi:hypothetical protein
VQHQQHTIHHHHQQQQHQQRPQQTHYQQNYRQIPPPQPQHVQLPATQQMGETSIQKSMNYQQRYQQIPPQQPPHVGLPATQQTVTVQPQQQSYQQSYQQAPLPQAHAPHPVQAGQGGPYFSTPGVNTALHAYHQHAGVLEARWSADSAAGQKGARMKRRRRKRHHDLEDGEVLKSESDGDSSGRESPVAAVPLPRRSSLKDPRLHPMRTKSLHVQRPPSPARDRNNESCEVSRGGGEGQESSTVVEEAAKRIEDEEPRSPPKLTPWLWSKLSWSIGDIFSRFEDFPLAENFSHLVACWSAYDIAGLGLIDMLCEPVSYVLSCTTPTPVPTSPQAPHANNHWQLRFPRSFSRQNDRNSSKRVVQWECRVVVSSGLSPKSSPSEIACSLCIAVNSSGVLPGGEWDAEVDGQEPSSTDCSPLIRTAIRTTKSSGLELSQCKVWIKLTEIWHGDCCTVFLLCNGDQACLTSGQHQLRHVTVKEAAEARAPCWADTALCCISLCDMISFGFGSTLYRFVLWKRSLKRNPKSNLRNVLISIAHVRAAVGHFRREGCFDLARIFMSIGLNLSLAQVRTLTHIGKEAIETLEAENNKFKHEEDQATEVGFGV